MMSAVISAKNNVETILIEKNARVGKKLSQTGNGKCNLANDNMTLGCFNDSKLVQRLMKLYPTTRVLEILNHELGLHTFSDNFGRVYPISENANSVVDCFRKACEKYGVKTVFDVAISIEKVHNGFVVHCQENDVFCNEVVVASGLLAQAKNQNVLLSDYQTELYPSLVPITVKNPDKSLDGLRQKCLVTLFKDGKKVYQEKGEVLFRQYGLSGVCIFNCSAYVARSKVQKENAKFKIVLDLLPTIDQKEILTIANGRQNSIKDDWFLGILSNKLACHVAKQSKDVFSAFQLAKNLPFEVVDTLGFEFAQATSGGIEEKHLDDNLTLPNGIKVCGEIINVDGLCGGNNLWFAFATGHLVSNN